MLVNLRSLSVAVLSWVAVIGCRSGAPEETKEIREPDAKPAATAEQPKKEVVFDPANPPPGCSFNPRCRYATDICRSQRPDLVEAEPGRLVACHHATTLQLRGIGEG